MRWQGTSVASWLITLSTSPSSIPHSPKQAALRLSNCFHPFNPAFLKRWVTTHQGIMSRFPGEGGRCMSQQCFLLLEAPKCLRGGVTNANDALQECLQSKNDLWPATISARFARKSSLRLGLFVCLYASMGERVGLRASETKKIRHLQNIALFPAAVNWEKLVGKHYFNLIFRNSERAPLLI